MAQGLSRIARFPKESRTTAAVVVSPCANACCHIEPRPGTPAFTPLDMKLGLALGLAKNLQIAGSESCSGVK